MVSQGFFSGSESANKRRFAGEKENKVALGGDNLGSVGAITAVGAIGSLGIKGIQSAIEGGKKLTLSFLKLNLFNNFYLIRSDQYSFGKKKNNIHEISKFLKKRNLLKTKIVKTYLEDDKITQYYK